MCSTHIFTFICSYFFYSPSIIRIRLEQLNQPNTPISADRDAVTKARQRKPLKPEDLPRFGDKNGAATCQPDKRVNSAPNRLTQIEVSLIPTRKTCDDAPDKPPSEPDACPEYYDNM